MGNRTGSRKRESRYDIDISRGENSLGRVLEEINCLIKRADRSKGRSNSDISVTGEIVGLVPKKDRLIYGFSIELEKGAKK